MRILWCFMAVLCCAVAGGLGTLYFAMAWTQHDSMAPIREDGAAVILANGPTVSTAAEPGDAQALDAHAVNAQPVDGAQAAKAQAAKAQAVKAQAVKAQAVKAQAVEAQAVEAQAVEAEAVDAPPANAADAAQAVGAEAVDAPPADAADAAHAVEAPLLNAPAVEARTADAHAAGADPPEPHPVGAEPSDAHPIDISEIDRVDECIDAEVCIDRYLWSLYERTRKIDTIRVPQEVKVAVKRKGRIRIITKTISKFVVEDFAWKDPEAARKAGMSPQDYVIGGMDPAFRVKLYHALRALDDAGLMPGITSAFRDDYRQTIASGQKARSDRSFHGGSFRGGYGHGLAADIVSVKGATHAEQLASSDVLWKWIDAHEKELGIGRPYLDWDAPHVGPLDGSEYLSRRGGPTDHAVKDRHRLAVLHHDHAKRTRLGRPARAQSRSTHQT
jgi:hypothetical protein